MHYCKAVDVVKIQANQYQNNQNHYLLSAKHLDAAGMMVIVAQMHFGIMSSLT